MKQQNGLHNCSLTTWVCCDSVALCRGSRILVWSCFVSFCNDWSAAVLRPTGQPVHNGWLAELDPLPQHLQIQPQCEFCASSLSLSLSLSFSLCLCLCLCLSHPLCNTAYLAYCAELSATFQNSVWSSLPCMLNRSYWGTPWLKCQSHFKFQYEAVYLACWTVDLIRAPRGWNVGQTSKFSLKQSTLQRAPYSWNVDQTSRFISDQ